MTFGREAGNQFPRGIDGGFQPWWGPYDGFTGWQGFSAWWDFVQAHEAKETDSVYAAHTAAVKAAVDKKFRTFLDFILKD